MMGRNESKKHFIRSHSVYFEVHQGVEIPHSKFKSIVAQHEPVKIYEVFATVRPIQVWARLLCLVDVRL
jgi:hypothetical protein